MSPSLDNLSRADIVNYRLEKSDSSLLAADVLASNKLFDSAVTRLYYACFHAASALLIQNNIECGSHAGVKRMLSLKFINTGLLDKKYIRYFSDLLNGRQLSDYEDFIYQNEESYSYYKGQAVDFCNAIKKLILSSTL